MSISIDEFVKFLADSGLVSSASIAKLRERISTNDGLKTTETLADMLVKDKILTKYQVSVLLQGEADSLIIGNYTILDKLGAGGMGQVYKAWHRRMKRLVALKTLPPSTMKKAASVQRFRREVEAVAKLNHRNIVTAHDADELAGVHFLIMEYVDGEDLSMLVRRKGPCSLADSLSYLLDAAHGLEYAHQQGVIHRDIKPRNLLVDSKGMVKVLDLGLARMRWQSDDIEGESLGSLTSSCQIYGTVDYMAPEQAANFKDVDQRADIYALGICLYFLLNGKVPYPGATVLERIFAHRDHPIPRLDKIQSPIPESVHRLYEAMVAKEPENRPQSMSEVVVALENCLREVQRGPQAVSHSSFTLMGTPGSPEFSTSEVAPTIPLVPHVLQRKYPLTSIAVLCVAVLAMTAAWSRWGRNSAETTPAASPDRRVQTLAGTADGPLSIPVETFKERYPNAPPMAVAPLSEEQSRTSQQAWAEYLGISPTETNSLGMTFQLIPPGEFLMGSSEDELTSLLQEGRDVNAPQWYLDLIPSEGPRHKVVMGTAFLMGSSEITQREYQLVMEMQDAADDGNRSDSPAGSITLFDAVEFCNRLSAREQRSPCYQISNKQVSRLDGDGYRLPTEEEWEYACRAGTQTRWYFGDDPTELTNAAWTLENSTGDLEPVRLKQPNVWGLYDMYGNAWEWCENNFHVYSTDAAGQGTAVNSEDAPGDRQIVRGGSAGLMSFVNRSANRTYYVPDFQGSHHGFRIMRTLPRASVRSSDEP